MHPAVLQGRIPLMPNRHFDLVSHWRVPGPPAEVWPVLAALQHWPAWWPQVRAVRVLRPGDEQGIGRVCRIDWRTRLGYGFTIEVEAVEAVPHERLRARSRGAMRGEGIWLLRADGTHTELTYLWRVDLQRPWMRLAAPLLAPLFRWNHEGVMRAGQAGLVRHLARRAAGRSGVSAPARPPLRAG
jgi:Polyketide cyclase / dehydrase and lipid transport